MKYLRKFATEADYQAFLNGGEYALPNASLIGETGEIKYNILIGVFIQHVDGTLYTTEEWTAGGFSKSQANGVAVSDIGAAFVMAKTEIGSRKWSHDTTNLIEGVMATTDLDTALMDYAGLANTPKIAAGGDGGAAYNCLTYSFPNGAKGYLPALGELQIVKKNRAAISSALTLIEGESLSGYYWSSTQYDATNAWSYFLSTYSMPTTKDAKANLLTVRAFTPLNL